MSFNLRKLAPAFAQRGSLGFTAIELLVTISIIAILTAVAAPSFTRLIDSQRLRNASSGLSESLWLARAEALKRNRNVSFTFTSATTGWSITDSLDNSTLQSQPGFSLVGSTIKSGTGVFTFNAYGRLNGSQQIELKNSSSTVFRCITITTTGKTSMGNAAC